MYINPMQNIKMFALFVQLPYFAGLMPEHLFLRHEVKVGDGHTDIKIKGKN